MRIRTVKPEFFTHEALFDAEKETGLPLRVAYAGLWCASDRAGRFAWEPRRLKAAILPYDDVDFSRVLHALTTRGFVVHYACSTREFGCIPSFSRHQVINNRERESDIPDVSNGQILDDACPTRAPRVNDACPTPLFLAQGEGKGREGNKEGKGSLPPASAVGSSEDLKLDSEEAPKPSKQPRKRDPLFDALASVDGSSPTEITPTYARQVGVSLAEIRKATPAVTPDEIRRRAANYVTHFRDAALTPSALKVHWSRCANPAKQSGNGHASQLPEGRDEDGNPLW